MYGQNLGNVIFGNKTKTEYIGQYADRHKVKNGMGIQRYHNGDVYCGDFHQGKRYGKGMLITAEGIGKYAPGSTVYIGNWQDGKMHGKATCYASNGDIVYRGVFNEGKPIEQYPSTNTDINEYFTMKELGDELFWGEVKKGIPHGIGLIVQSDGGLWFGTLKNGVRTGVSITIYNSDCWEVGEWENGKYRPFDNSEIVASRRDEYKAAKKKIRSQLSDEFWGVAQGLAEVGMNITTLTNKSKQVSFENKSTQDIEQNMNKRKTPKASVKTNSKNDCGSAWMSDSRTYSNYETQLIRDIGSLSSSDISRIKSSMRSIRQKWEKRGCIITKSPQE